MTDDNHEDDDLPTLEEWAGIHARDDLEPGAILAKSREWDREDREREEAKMQRWLERLGKGEDSESSN